MSLSQAFAKTQYVHSPELFELVSKHFHDKEIVFTQDISLPSFNDKKVYKYDSPNRRDYFNATYPFLLKTSIKNVSKFAIFIIPGWGDKDHANTPYAYETIQREVLLHEGENIELSNLKTYIQFSVSSAVYFVAETDDKILINYKFFTNKKNSYRAGNASKLVGVLNKKPVNHIVKWNKYGTEGTVFGQESMAVGGRFKNQLISLRFRFGRSVNGYHYRSSHYSNDYEKPISSYIKFVEISINQKKKYAFTFGPSSTTGYAAGFRLVLDIPYTNSVSPVVDVAWRDNRGTTYKKANMQFNDGKLKSADVAIITPDSELYLPIKSGNLSQVIKLLKSGSDPNASYLNGLTPVALALAKRKNEILEALISYGADSNQTFLHGLTPLMWAVASSNFEAIELLVQAGASSVITDDEGLTAFDRVFYFYKKRGYNQPHQTRANKRKLVRLLTTSAQHFDDESFLRLVKKTIEFDFYDLMRDYVDAGMPPNFGRGIVLRYFIEGLIFDYAQTLIKRGGDVNVLDSKGMTIRDHINKKLKKCTDSSSYTYSSSYCVMLENEMPEINKLLNKLLN